jgi:hypothetical protein
MKTNAALLRISLSFALMPAIVSAQGAKDPTRSGQGTKGAGANSGLPSVPLRLDKLETCKEVLDAGTDFAAGIVGNTSQGNSIIVPAGESLLYRVLAASRTKCTPMQELTAQTTTSQTNKQTGATPQADGSTSAVEKTAVSQLLAIAVENGGIVNNVSGNTMTLSTSAYGLFAALFGDSAQSYARCWSSHCGQLGASATFNLTDTSDPLGSATHKQVSQWQAKYSFLDKSARSHRVDELWIKGPRRTAQAMMTAARAHEDQDLKNELQGLSDRIVSVTSENASELIPMISASRKTGNAKDNQQINIAVANKVLSYLDTNKEFQEHLQRVINLPSEKAWAEGFSDSLIAFEKSRGTFEDEVKGLVKGFNGDLTFGEQYPSAPASSSSSSASKLPSASASGTGSAHQPTYLIAGLDFSWDPKSKAGIDPPKKIPSWTLNFKSSFYPNPNPALKEGAFRGGHVAGQLQWSLGSGPFIKGPDDKSQVTLSLNSNYERLQENQHQTGKKADVIVGNGKLEIPISSGVSFPLSISVANASEQVKETYVRGNFGLSFDLDKLASLLKASHP